MYNKQAYRIKQKLRNNKAHIKRKVRFNSFAKNTKQLKQNYYFSI